jgi:hypothetical protein
VVCLQSLDTSACGDGLDSWIEINVVQRQSQASYFIKFLFNQQLHRAGKNGLPFVTPVIFLISI